MVTVFDGELTVQFSFSFTDSEPGNGRTSFEKTIIDQWLYSESKQAYYTYDVEFFISRWNKSLCESLAELDWDLYDPEDIEHMKYVQLSSEPTYTVAPTNDFYDFLRDSNPRWVASMQENEFEKLGFLNADGQPIEEIADHILRYTSPEVKREEVITALTDEKARRERFPLVVVKGFQQGIVRKERLVRAEKMLPLRDQGLAR